MRAWLLLAVAVLVAGCGTFDPLYTCQTSGQCVDPARSLMGQCVDGACAFPAADCPSQLRFDESAGPERAGQCTMPSGPPAASFHQLGFPGGKTDVASLNALFVPGGPQQGAGSGEAYVAGWEGHPLLWRYDGTLLTAVPAPPAQDPILLGTAAGQDLFVATKGMLYHTGDQGMTWDTSAVPGLSGLFDDGNLLYGLLSGQLLTSTNLGQLLLPDGPATGVALFGRGTMALALVDTMPGRASLYRRGSMGWVLSTQTGVPLSAGWLSPSGTWFGVGQGGILEKGAPLTPPSPMPVQALDGTVDDDLWALPGGTPYLLHLMGGKWQQVVPDPQGLACTGLLVVGTQVLAVTTRQAGQGTRSLLWRM